MQVSCYEIYNDYVADLAAPTRPHLAVRHDRAKGFYVEGLQTAEVSTCQEALEFVHRALVVRAIRCAYQLVQGTGTYAICTGLHAVPAESGSSVLSAFCQCAAAAA